MVTIIIIGVLVLTMGLASSFMGQTEVIISGALDRAHRAREAVSSCVDEALNRLRLDSTYTGGTVPIGTLNCTVTVSGSGAARTIAASTTDGDYTQAVTVGAAFRQNGSATSWEISSWVEANFP